MLDTKEKIGEIDLGDGEVAEVYRDDMSQMYDKRLHEYDIACGYVLDMYEVLMISYKDTERYFIRRKDAPYDRFVHEITSPQEFDLIKFLLMDGLKNDCDVVRMAERRKKNE